MKQNERLLVYAVTGFLALILVVAVLFSRDPAKDGKSGAARDLDQVLGQESKPGDKSGKDAGADGSRTGLPGPNDVSPQPLAAGAPRVQVAAELVTQQLGVSRRDRNVRFVRVKQNDSLDVLVRRWCGSRDPFLAEAKSLNEDLTTLKIGNEVAVPWVDDEVVLAALDASKPKVLTSQEGTAPALGMANDARVADANASKETPSFAQPGKRDAAAKDDAGKKPTTGSGNAAVAAGTTYTVKSGDNLWKIAERTYGKKNATQMVEAIKHANDGLGDRLPIGQKIKLPPAPAGG